MSAPHLDAEVGPQWPGGPQHGLVRELLVVQAGVLQTLRTRRLQPQLRLHPLEGLTLDVWKFKKRRLVLLKRNRRLNGSRDHRSLSVCVRVSVDRWMAAGGSTANVVGVLIQRGRR